MFFTQLPALVLGDWMTGFDLGKVQLTGGLELDIWQIDTKTDLLLHGFRHQHRLFCLCVKCN